MCFSLHMKRAAGTWQTISRTQLAIYPLSTRLKLLIGQSLLLLAVCLVPVSTMAQDAPVVPDATPTPTPSHWNWSLMIRNRTGFKLNHPHQFQLSRTIVDGKGRYKINDNWRLALEARAHYDPVKKLGYPSSLWLDPRQVLLEGKVKQVDLKLGLQQVVWGQADGLRVLDVINPLDYREFILEDFLDSRRPLWMARADLPLAKGSLQLLWIPYFAPGRLPVEGDEFGVGQSFGSGLIKAALADSPLAQLSIQTDKAKRPAYNLKASQFGARFSQSLGSWDWTANYFFGWEDVPTNYLGGIATQSNKPLPILVLSPSYDRKEVLGMTGTTNFGPVVLRLEAGWNRKRAVAVTDQPIQDGYIKTCQISSVAGLDYSPREWVWLSGQYFYSQVTVSRERLLFPQQTHLLSFAIRTKFFRDQFKPELFILTGLNQQQYLLRPRIWRNWGDFWGMGIGADFLGGSTRNVFGYFQSRDRIVLELKWQR
jgi:hypothetical protein